MAYHDPRRRGCRGQGFAGRGTVAIDCAQIHKRLGEPRLRLLTCERRLFDLRAKRDLNHGFGNAYGRSFELVVTPLIFGGIGWLIDRAVGTHLVFMIGLAVFAVCGMFVRVWLGYDTEMRRHENELFGFRSAKAGGTGGTVDETVDAQPDGDE